MHNRLTFNVKTLGCKVNQAESEEFIDEMVKSNFIYKPDGNFVDISIVNTCTVTSKADRKSLSVIRQAIKKSNYTFVTGCYSELEKDLIQKENKIHSIIEHKNKKKMVSLIRSAIEKENKVIDISKSIQGQMHRLDSKDMNTKQSTFFKHSRSFVKIQDGCNDFCTYCRIPFSRGIPVSRSATDILTQVKRLKDSGSPEIVLTGINLGKYQNGDIGFATILSMILDSAGDMGVRISSIEPMTITDEVISAMNTKNIVPHIHLSLQSGSDSVLKEMARHYSAKDFYELVNKIKSINPYFSITTDVIVGFPGEGEKEFQETYDFVQKCGFVKLHVFPFSSRPLTKAYDMAETVSVQEKKLRVEKLRLLSNKMYENYLSSIKNEPQKMIIEKVFNKEQNKYEFLNKENDQYFQRYKYYYSGVSQFYIRGVLGSNEELSQRQIVSANLFKDMEPILI